MYPKPKGNQIRCKIKYAYSVSFLLPSQLLMGCVYRNPVDLPGHSLGFVVLHRHSRVDCGWGRG
jgi:hypothetical protein